MILFSLCGGKVNSKTSTYLMHTLSMNLKIIRFISFVATQITLALHTKMNCFSVLVQRINIGKSFHAVITGEFFYSINFVDFFVIFIRSQSCRT